MKMLIIFMTLFSASAFATTEKFQITCNQEDCFKNGWKMISLDSNDFFLEAECRKNNCSEFGWDSFDTKGSLFRIVCHNSSCFESGWTSIEKQLFEDTKIDKVSCINSSCLNHGWSVSTNYGESGQAYCNNGDCSRFGGGAVWRGKTSKTTCIKDDCYRFGWYLEIKK